MGINDRDYMKKDEGQGDVINVGELVIVLLKLAVVFVAVILSLRFPLLWIKIPLVIGVLFGGWRWIFNTKKKKTVSSTPPKEPEKLVQAKVVSSRRANLEQLEAEAGNPPKPDQSSIRLLIAYDAAGEFGQAKALIQHFNGKEFPEPVVEEFAVLARNYFPIELEPTESGVRFKLA
ncbi:MAG: hypothetical protein ACKVJU_04810 [Verrucomicrobiales bacterium]